MGQLHSHALIVHSIRASRLFPTRAQRPWLRGRRSLSFADLARAAEAGDADAIEGMLSLALADGAASSPLARQALDTLRDLLGEDDQESDDSPAPESDSGKDLGGHQPGRARGDGKAGREGRGRQGQSRGRWLARLEVEASCFEYVEKDPAVTVRMPALLLEAASRHAQDRGYHVTGDAISAALAVHASAQEKALGKSSQ